MLGQPELLFEQHTGIERIEVWQQQNLRWMNINGIEQSRIDLARPEKLVSPVSHALMVSMLFMKSPQRVLLAGLGGGAIARYLHARDPAMQGDVVEIDSTVAMLAQRYFSFPLAGWRIAIDDIKNWQGENYDLIVVDIADGDRTPAWLSSEDILLQLKEQLSSSGVMAINLLVDDAAALTRNLVALRSVFNRRTLCLSVPDFKNIAVLAFSDTPDYSDKRELRARAQAMSEPWGIEFEPILDRIQKENPIGSGVW